MFKMIFTEGFCSGFTKGGFGGCSPVPRAGTRVHSDVPPAPKNRNKGTFGCVPVPKAGTRADSPKPPFYETAPFQKKPGVRNFSARIFLLGPEMAAPILWAPGIFSFFLLGNLHAHKIPRFRGGGWGV